MFDEDDLLPISALQHLVFCERQWGLIHLEGAWDENRLTAEGRIFHEKTHERGSETRGGVRVARSLRLRSLRLGLTGQADVVEFHPVSGSDEPEGQCARLPGLSGRWRPLPIEYKRGRPKPGPWDKVQVCAQAVCLEEMLKTHIPAGALFYGQPRRRLDVDFDSELRSLTEEAAARLHVLTRLKKTPPGRYEKRCGQCSLYDLCLPKSTGGGRSAREFLTRALAGIMEESK